MIGYWEHETGVQNLIHFCDEHRLDKKYLIVPSYQVGHQAGEALAQ